MQLINKLKLAFIRQTGGFQRTFSTAGSMTLATNMAYDDQYPSQDYHYRYIDLISLKLADRLSYFKSASYLSATGTGTKAVAVVLHALFSYFLLIYLPE